MLALVKMESGRGARKRASLSPKRVQLRTRLRPLALRIRHLGVLAEQAIEGPDPEASLVFLSMLRRRLDEALASR